MTDDQAEAFQAQLHRLATEIVLRNPHAVPDAVDLACDLIVARFDGPSTVDVAALAADATFGDAEALLRAMLSEHGVHVPQIHSDEDMYVVLRTAFGFWNLPLREFEGPFYARLPAWADQHPLDRTLVALLDERDQQTNPTRRAEIENRMRRVVREATANSTE